MFQKNKTQLRFVSLEERIVFDASGVIFVDATVAAGGDGSSWAQAYNNLDSALAAASASVGGDQLWIADGTYKPAGGLNTSTFSLPDDVQLYGGFKGNESSLAMRNPVINISKLSGDFLNNDLSDPLDAGYAASKADNAWHVLTAMGVNATLDSLTVEKGYAFGSGPLNDKGGGLLLTSGSDVVMNKVIFDQNSAMINGGGILVSDSSSTLMVSKSLFQNNNHLLPNILVTQDTGGGAIAVLNDGYIEVSKSVFKNNTAGIGHGPGADHTNSAGHDGAAIALNNSSGLITNSLFQNNIALSGGAITVQSLGETTPHTLTIDSSVFISNRAEHVGGAIDVLGFVPPHPDSMVTIRNSLFHDNVGVIFGGAVYFDSYNGLIENSIFTNNSTTGQGGAVVNLEFLNAGNSLIFGQPLPPHLLTINNSSFVNNQVVGDPQAFFHMEATFGFVFDLQTDTGGGAILNASNGNMTILDSSFINNRTIDAEGGAIKNGGWEGSLFGIPLSLQGANLTIERSSFIANKATGNGGAIISSSQSSLGPLGPTLDVSDSTFIANHAPNGGAIYLERVTAEIKDNVFKKSNSADLLADQIYASDSIVNAIHSSNSALLKQNLIMNNQFYNLDNDDLYLI